MMSERYITVTDDEYCYTLDTEDENYKTLEDFEKQEFESANDVDIEEESILDSAWDKYWEWVYDNYIESDTINDKLNALYDENQQLKISNEKYKRLTEIKEKKIKNRIFTINKIAKMLKYLDGDIMFKDDVNPNDAVKEVLEEILYSEVEEE